jgi:hypothetical protein
MVSHEQGVQSVCCSSTTSSAALGISTHPRSCAVKSSARFMSTVFNSIFVPICGCRNGRGDDGTELGFGAVFLSEADDLRHTF